MEKYRPVVLQDFSGGWNSKWAINATQLEENQSPYLVNIDYAARFAFTKRRGTVRVGDNNATAGSGKSIFNFKKLDGTEVLIKSHTTVLQYLNAGIWTDFKTGLTSGLKFDFVSNGTLVAFCNGTDNYATWDGTTYTEYAAAPKGNILCVAYFKVFVAGVAAQPQRLYYSDTGSFSSFSGGSSGSTDFPGRIMSAISYYNRDGLEAVQVFLSNGQLYEFGFDSSGTPYKHVIRQSVGAVSHRATRQLENYNFVVDIFQAVRGIGYEENQADVRASSRSILIEDYLKTLNVSNAAAEYAFRTYMLAAQDPNGSTNNVEVLYDELYNSWRLYTGHQVNQYTIYQNKVTFVCATDLNVYQYDSTKYQDALGESAVPIYCEYNTRSLDFGDPIREKGVRYIKVAGFISTGCLLQVDGYSNNSIISPIFTKVINGDGAYVQSAVSFPWGAAAWATQPFASFGGTTSTIQVRPFWVAIQVSSTNFNDIRLKFSNYQADVDFIITDIKPLHTLLAEERIPVVNQL
jgi:hypothetical protein